MPSLHSLGPLQEKYPASAPRKPLLALGILISLLGLLAFTHVLAASATAASMVAAVLLGFGVLQMIQALRTRKTQRVLGSSIIAGISLVTAAVVLRIPELGLYPGRMNGP